MRKLDISNIYSPRQASGPREGKKILTTLRIQFVVGHGKINNVRLITTDKTAIMCIV